MFDIHVYLRTRGPVARRCELIAAGATDRDLQRELAAGRIFRVRHGWYARAGTPDSVARAVRVGGMVTGLAALSLRGLFLPRGGPVDIAVPRNAAALRHPARMRKRLEPSDSVRAHWILDPRNSLPSREWLASEDDALVVVLHTASREVAVGACDGLLRYRGWTAARLDAAFARAPLRVQSWRDQVDGRADAWGETVVRLRLADAGIRMVPQPDVPGVGRFDGQVAPGVFIEIDGHQHDETWAGPEGSSFERDHLKDLGLAARGARSIRITYPMFEQSWGACLRAIQIAIELDERVQESLRRRPARGRGSTAASARGVQGGSSRQKLRTIFAARSSGRATRRPGRESPEFSTGTSPSRAQPRRSPVLQ